MRAPLRGRSGLERTSPRRRKRVQDLRSAAIPVDGSPALSGSPLKRSRECQGTPRTELHSVHLCRRPCSIGTYSHALCLMLPRGLISAERERQGPDVKVLVVGGGGREHSLAWKAARSPRVRPRVRRPRQRGHRAGSGRSRTWRWPPATSRGLRRIRPGRGRRPHHRRSRGAAGRRYRGSLRGGGTAHLRSPVVERACKARSLQGFLPRSSSRASRNTRRRQPDLRRSGRRRSTTSAPEALPSSSRRTAWRAAKGVVIAHNRRRRRLRGRHRHARRRSHSEKQGRRVVVEDYLEGEEASFIAIVGAGQSPAARPQPGSQGDRRG